ncbi:MAG: hypothetical protein ACXAEU_01800 [Candidatus Hodarchaeales archaeon]|jgi:rRNA small subunit pseudouridine methyltransferase Nep1
MFIWIHSNFQATVDHIMLTLVLYRCGLQLVKDKKLLNHPAMRRIKLEKGLETSALLDLGLVHDAIHDPRLKESGRPDIVHSAIVAVTGAPFWSENKVRFIVHTIEDKMWEIDREWRPPVNYFRFYWLIDRFLREKSLSFGNRKMTIKKQSIHGLLAEIAQEGMKPTVFLLSRAGKQQGLLELAQVIKKEKCPVIIVGGYQRGPAMMELQESLVEKYPVSSWKLANRSLLASTALSRLLFGLEFF